MNQMNQTRCSLLILVWMVFILMNCAHKINSINNLIGEEDDLTQDRRRLVEPVTVAILSAIAATVTASVNVGKVAASAINKYGAQITVNNYFKYVDLHCNGWTFVEGEQIGTVDEVILQKKQGAGGVFSDKEWISDGSAGIVRYKAINPISRKEYCFEYLWSIDAYAINVRAPMKDNLLSGMAIVISSGFESRCSKDITTAFNEIKNYWIAKAKANAGPGPSWQTYGVNWNFKFEDYWSTNVRIAFEAKNTQKGLSISSSDLRVGMSASMTNEWQTVMQITIGPYKKVFGNALTGNWQILVAGWECTNADSYLGTFDNVKDCHFECIDRKGNDCKYFIFGNEFKYGKCYWENGCSEFEADQYVVIANVGTDIELFESGRKCNSGQAVDLGTFATIDECADKCKREKGNACILFEFGHIYSQKGKCFWVESCASTAGSAGYNIYVIKSRTNTFSGKSANDKYIAIDSPPIANHNKDTNWGIHGILYIVLICFTVALIIYNVYCCVLISKEKKSHQNAIINDKL